MVEGRQNSVLDDVSQIVITGGVDLVRVGVCFLIDVRAKFHEGWLLVLEHNIPNVGAVVHQVVPVNAQVVWAGNGLPVVLVDLTQLSALLCAADNRCLHNHRNEDARDS